MQKHMDLLGLKARDKVTGFEGVVSTVSFDLYGCIQVVLTPPLDGDGKKQDGVWFDVARLEVTDDVPVMDVPDFESGPIADGKHGPAEKPMK